MRDGPAHNRRGSRAAGNHATRGARSDPPGPSEGGEARPGLALRQAVGRGAGTARSAAPGGPAEEESFHAARSHRLTTSLTESVRPLQIPSRRGVGRLCVGSRIRRLLWAGPSWRFKAIRNRWRIPIVIAGLIQLLLGYTHGIL